jgi:lysophospholipase L1-like esterase
MKSLRKNIIKKNFFTNVLLLIFSTIISILALEQSYRFFLFGNASFSINKMSSINGLGELGLLIPSKSPEIIFELKPNMNTYHKLVEFKTNSAGLRDKEYSVTKTEDVFRIAVIGDSFVMADGIAIEENFHSLLEERLNKEQGDVTYQFINFGVSGYYLTQYLEVMKHKAIDYDPDLILVGFCPRNDQYIPEEQKYRDVPKTYSFFHFYSIQAFIDVYERGTYYDDDIYYMEKELTRNEPFSGKQKIYMTEIFSEMDDFSKQNNVPIIIMYLDIFYNEKFANELEKIVLKNNLYFVNLSLPFKGQGYEEFIIYPIDSHPNGKAHRLFADVLYDYLFLDTVNNNLFLGREIE